MHSIFSASDRRVVLVRHDIRHDLMALDLINFDFLTFNITILDTQRLSREIRDIRIECVC